MTQFSENIFSAIKRIDFLYFDKDFNLNDGDFQNQFNVKDSSKK